MRLAALLLSAALSMGVGPSSAAEGGSDAGGSQNCGADAFKNNVAGSESQGSGGYQAQNKYGYLGKYQMGEMALIDAGYAKFDGNSKDNVISWTGKDGVNSNSEFLNNTGAQEGAYNSYLNNGWSQIKSFGFDKYVGQTYNGTTITESGLLKGMQFGGVRMKQFFSNGMSCSGGAGMDGNNKCIGDYISSGSGFDVSSITGGSGGSGGGSCGGNDGGGNKDGKKPNDQGSTNAGSRTCPPTMQIIQGIDCGRFPAKIQAFCQTYKPYLMTMSKCQEAEQWAKGQGMGQHRDKCAKQSDAQGTMAWGYVLACSKSKDEPAFNSRNQLNDLDGKGGGNGSGTSSDASPATPAGKPDDPGCYDRLEKMGVKFTRMNKLTKSSGGFNCVVPTALAVKSFSKTSLSNPGVILNCNTAEAFEKLSSQIGVSKVTSLGGFVCRGINNGSAGARSRLSEHGEGVAFDVSNWQGSSGTWNPSWTNRSDPTYLAVTSRGPGVGFRCILTPWWYKTKSSPLIVGHIHLGTRDNCSPKV
jgi:hypothetical protein